MPTSRSKRQSATASMSRPDEGSGETVPPQEQSRKASILVDQDVGAVEGEEGFMEISRPLSTSLGTAPGESVISSKDQMVSTGSNGHRTTSKGKAPWFSPSTAPPIPPYLSGQVLIIACSAAALGVLAGLVLPRAVLVFSPARVYRAFTVGLADATRHGSFPLTSQRTSSTLLEKLLNKASASALSSRTLTVRWSERLSGALLAPQLHLYLFSWASFHLLEFIITARYNNTRLYEDSFLLNNGIAYYYAHGLGLLEFIVEGYFAPRWKALWPLTYIGYILVLIGQTARSLAMVHASSNFSHAVAWRKRPDHELVTTGIYAFSRHPSYFGFYTWAIGTQVLLGNPLAVVFFAVTLWRFFYHRIQGEEKYLIEFFGEDYVSYKKRVGTKLPFMW